MKISWTEAGLENGFWSANGGEAFRLKSTPTTPILPGYENLNRGGVSNIWGAAERVQGRPGGLDKASRPHTLRCGPWSSGRSLYLLHCPIFPRYWG